MNNLLQFIGKPKFKLNFMRTFFCDLEVLTYRIDYD